MSKKLLIFILLVCISNVYSQSNIAIIGAAVNGWTEDTVVDENYWPFIYPNAIQPGEYVLFDVELNDGYVKFVEVDNPDNVYGGDAFPEGEISDGEIPVNAGLYTVTLDLNSNTYFFDAYPKVYMGYSAEGDNQFQTEDQVFFELPAREFGDGFRFILEDYSPSIFEPHEHGSNSFPTGTASGYHPIPIEAGYYRVTFNLDTYFYAFIVPDVGLVGTAVNGWPEDEEDTPDVFMESEDGFTYSLSNVFLEEGELKFRQDGAWEESWSGTGFPSGDLINSEMDAIIIPESGFYDVSFHRQDQTYSFTTFSTSDFDFKQVQIYPNPTQKKWHVDFGNLDIKTLQIYSITGKLINEVKPEKSVNQLSIDASSYADGVYLAKFVTYSGGTKTIKLIKN